MLGQILIHTPIWVWALLAMVLWLGWRDLRVCTIRPVRLAILPTIGTTMSLFSIVTSAQPLLSVPAWVLATAAGVPLGMLIARRRRLAVTPDQRLWLAGSWFSMLFGLAIFAVRYVMGVEAALHPGLARDPAWIVANTAIGGVVTGVGLGWLAFLVMRYRRALRAHPGNATRLMTTA